MENPNEAVNLVDITTDEQKTKFPLISLVTFLVVLEIWLFSSSTYDELHEISLSARLIFGSLFPGMIVILSTLTISFVIKMFSEQKFSVLFLKTLNAVLVVSSVIIVFSVIGNII